MDLVKKLKCEKKLDDLLDKNYGTSDDSRSESISYVGNDYPQTTDRSQRLKAKNKHRWYHFFKPKNSEGTRWDDAVRNHRFSEDHFATFPDDDRNPTNDPRYCYATSSIGENDPRLRPNNEDPEDKMVESEKYWKANILPQFNADERDLLAESLFSHVWKTQGKATISKILDDFDSDNLSRKADDYFEHGCQLWGAHHTEAAYVDFERSRRIREVQSAQKSLLHGRHLTNDKNNQLAQEIAESNAELYFALGMVQSAKENLYASLREFRRSMQISALGLGMEHELTKASIYMIRSTCLAMGQMGHEIQHSISLLVGDIEHEIEADKLYAIGKREQALIEYANLKLLYDSDSMVQARIITKMATIFEEKRDYPKAMDLWTDLLLLCSETPSLGLHHPLARHALAKVVEARKQIQPWSEI